jgi:hypothetical protein
MKKIVILTMAAVVLVAGTAVATNDFGFRLIREVLTGYEEVAAVSTTGRGTFTAFISRGSDEIRYVLRYSDLEGDVQQAHIHFGARGTNGEISAFLCSNLANPPAGTPACPAPGGSVEGVIEPTDVIGPADRGIEAGAFDELVAAIRAGTTYVNVHSSKWPGGEIRAQISHDHR